jgi:hypothetical protein
MHTSGLHPTLSYFVNDHPSLLMASKGVRGTTQRQPPSKRKMYN